MDPSADPIVPDATVARSFEALQRLTDAALAYLSLDELLTELLRRVSDLLRSDTAAFLLLDERSGMLVARAAKGIEEEVEQGVRIPLGRGFAGRIAAERRPITIEDVDHADILNPILRQKGIRSLLGVPLIIEGRVIGVLHVGTLVKRLFDANDRGLLQLAADRAALAIEHAAFQEQRRTVAALQRTLMPDPLPRLPGVELAARYVPAAVGGTVGGDWFDVFLVGGGRVGLVVGDVMGRGVAAASVMTQMRTALRAYALDGHSPAAVVERVNRLVASAKPITMTTLVYAILDPERGDAVVVSAGHPPPLVVPPEGEAGFAAVEGDPPVGVSGASRFHEHRVPVPSGSTMVLVTDGAVEVRGESVDEGLERLRALATAKRNTQQLCSAIARGEVTRRPPEDDLAVLAARMVPLPDHLQTSWPAEAEALAGLRHLLRRWLGERGADSDTVYEITVAVQEAAANAVEHAYAPGAAAFDVDATFDGGSVTIEVRDRGSWRAARGEHRGRGLPMMRALMDSVDVHRSEEGTTIVLCRRLGNGGSGAVAA